MARSGPARRLRGGPRPSDALGAGCDDGSVARRSSSLLGARLGRRGRRFAWGGACAHERTSARLEGCGTHGKPADDGTVRSRHRERGTTNGCGDARGRAALAERACPQRRGVGTRHRRRRAPGASPGRIDVGGHRCHAEHVGVPAARAAPSSGRSPRCALPLFAVARTLPGSFALAARGGSSPWHAPRVALISAPLTLPSALTLGSALAPNIELGATSSCALTLHSADTSRIGTTPRSHLLVSMKGASARQVDSCSRTANGSGAPPVASGTRALLQFFSARV
jgi:hypothetical protein